MTNEYCVNMFEVNNLVDNFLFQCMQYSQEKKDASGLI